MVQLPYFLLLCITTDYYRISPIYLSRIAQLWSFCKAFLSLYWSTLASYTSKYVYISLFFLIMSVFISYTTLFTMVSVSTAIGYSSLFTTSPTDYLYNIWFKWVRKLQKILWKLMKILSLFQLCLTPNFPNSVHTCIICLILSMLLT